jgi:hypothetical protein
LKYLRVRPARAAPGLEESGIGKKVYERRGLEPRAAVLREAVLAVDRAALCRLERDLALLSTV